MRLSLAVLCAALVFCSATAQSVVNDNNAIVDIVFQTYYKAINISGTLTGCRPFIVKGIPGKGSVIQPVNGWRARVALIVERGTCQTTDRFTCMVNWDVSSNTMSKQDFNSLSPCQLTHEYPQIDHSYTVMAFYCLIDANGDVMPGCCDQYNRNIDVSQY